MSASAKSLGKRFLEISKRGGSKANTKELMKRWNTFVSEKVTLCSFHIFFPRRFRRRIISPFSIIFIQYKGDSEDNQEVEDMKAYLDELKQFEVRPKFDFCSYNFTLFSAPPFRKKPPQHFYFSPLST